MVSRKLLSAVFFYKYDTPEGPGAALLDAAGIVGEFESHCELIYREAVKAGEVQRLVSVLFAQLNAYSAKKSALTTREHLLVIGNILLLTKCGFINQDEFNGARFLYSDSVSDNRC